MFRTPAAFVHLLRVNRLGSTASPFSGFGSPYLAVGSLPLFRVRASSRPRDPRELPARSSRKEITGSRPCRSSPSQHGIPAAFRRRAAERDRRRLGKRENLGQHAIRRIRPKRENEPARFHRKDFAQPRCEGGLARLLLMGSVVNTHTKMANRLERRIPCSRECAVGSRGRCRKLWFVAIETMKGIHI